MQLLRSSLLWASQNRRIERIVRSSSTMRPLVNRFMPGETIDDAMRAVKELAKERTPSIVTYLGENVTSDAAADQTVAEYERLIARLSDDGSDCHVSIKLTQFGWDLDRSRALARVRKIAQLAQSAGIVLPIDMESSPYVESTIEAYETLAREFADVAVCLQAYLHRTSDDVKRLIPIKPYIRLVKGAYRELPNVAVLNRDELRVKYRALAKELLSATREGARVALGTHDTDLLRDVRGDARDMGLSHDAYEIQMLYGIQNEARRALAAEGERVRVLISYGKAWYAWFMRRLAEKPSNLMLVARR